MGLVAEVLPHRLHPWVWEDELTPAADNGRVGAGGVR